MKKNYKIDELIYRTNELVTFEIVKLISSKSKFLGYFKLKDCLSKAKELKKDLVEISTKNNFSVCKIINFNKFKYLEKKKKNKLKLEYKKKNFIINNNNKKIKEIKFHLFIAKNDYNNKIKQITKFLNKGLKVRVTFVIKGREVLKTEMIRNNIYNIILDVEPFGNLNNCPNLSKKLIFLYFDPKDVKTEK